MLAVAAAQVPADERGWAFELKLDGARGLYHASNGHGVLRSRTGRDLTGCLPELAQLARCLGALEVVLDGELIVADPEGRPNFDQVLQRLRASSPPLVRQLRRELPVTFMIFDLLWLRDRPTLDLPYLERRAQLEELRLAGPHWHTVDCFTGVNAGTALLRASRAHGLEGIVAKRTTSPYRPGRRSRAWLKVKNFTRQSFWVGGWLPSSTGAAGLLLGERTDEADGRLHYAGLVEFGYTPSQRAELAHRLAPLQRTTSPFVHEPSPSQLRAPFRSRGAPVRPVFVEPVLLVEVQFLARTTDGRLRHASYKGLRNP
jgi:bifunctional non-homologous end joining protein LigD